MRARVAVVTGASRGVGRGIAVALGAHGYTVYLTGRTRRAGEASRGGTIHDTAAAVTAAGVTVVERPARPAAARRPAA